MRRVVDGEVVQTRRARGGRRPVLALPGVEADVVMIATCREERCAFEVEEQIEAQIIPVEADRALQICNFEMHVTDARLGWNGCFRQKCLLLVLPEQPLCSVICSTQLHVKVIISGCGHGEAMNLTMTCATLAYLFHDRLSFLLPYSKIVWRCNISLSKL